MRPDQRYRRSTRAVAAEVAGEITLLDTEAGLYFGLQGPGAEVWSLLEQPRSMGELVASLCDQYEVSAEQCEADTQELLRSLTSRGLVEVVSG